jgi:putative flippase GtrA
MRRLLAQFSQFGVVGLIGFGLDFVLFNVLRATVLNPEVVVHGTAYATIISTVVAVVFNWLGNRFWTFRHQRHHHWFREGIEFAVVSAGGLLITLGCLFVSTYVLNLHGVIADNIAKNVVGLGLGTVFRFALYRLWVFRGHEPEPLTGPIHTTDAFADDRTTVVNAYPTSRSRPGARTAPAADAPRRD